MPLPGVQTSREKSVSDYRKPDKTAHIRLSDTNPLEYRVGVTVDDEQDQNRTNSRQPAPRSATGNSAQLPGGC